MGMDGMGQELWNDFGGTWRSFFSAFLSAASSLRILLEGPTPGSNLRWVFTGISAKTMENHGSFDGNIMINKPWKTYSESLDGTVNEHHL